MPQLGRITLLAWTEMMTPRDRIDHCREIMAEVAQVQMPWFCSSARYSQIASTYSASQFGLFVYKTRKCGNPPDLWAIVSEKLAEWEIDIHSKH
jgi:hypothetical protein